MAFPSIFCNLQKIVRRLPLSLLGDLFRLVKQNIRNMTCPCGLTREEIKEYKKVDVDSLRCTAPNRQIPSQLCGELLANHHSQTAPAGIPPPLPPISSNKFFYMFIYTH
jgi:hypothetical protein